MRDPSAYPLALSTIQGVGAVLFKKLVDHFGSAKKIFSLPAKELQPVMGAKKEVLQAIVQKDTVLAAEKLLAHQRARGLQVLAYGEPDYPQRLRHIPDPPPILYSMGQQCFNTARVVSIVGTREATAYGRATVAGLVAQLKPYGALIVSGLASGIDTHAHRTALEHRLPTVGVVAGGLDRLYPAYHEQVARQMQQQGAVLSEYPLGVRPTAHHFPVRNRIIAGMADATIVIEAKKKSGALITALCANQYHREVFATPGALGQEASEGCHYLIKTHQAHLLTQAADLAYVLNWKPLEASKPAAKRLYLDVAALPKEEQRPVQVLQGMSGLVSLQQLREKTRLAADTLSAIMVRLELKNMIDIMPGNKYRLRAG